MPINPVIPSPGLAEYESDSIGAVVELFAGDTPAPVTTTVAYTAEQAAAGIPAYTPITISPADGSFTVSTSADANAITVGVLRAGAGGGVAGRMAVYREGCFNIDAINWPSELATESDRINAFAVGGAPIYIKKPYYS